MSLYMGGEGRRLHGQTTPSELRDKFMMSVRMPVGVVGAITPWNFPIAIPSLEARAGARLRQHRRAEARRGHAAARRALRRAARPRQGVPPGVVNIVHGFGEEAGEALVAPSRTSRSSPSPARARPASRSRRRRPTTSSTSTSSSAGKNAIIVMDDADVDLAVDGIVWSAFGTSGPALHRGVARDRARARLRRAAAEARRGGGEAAARAGLGGRHRRRPGDQPRRAREDPRATPQIGRDEGATLLTGGEIARRPRLLLPADGVRRRRCRRCGSRRRRSSARRLR